MKNLNALVEGLYYEWRYNSNGVSMRDFVFKIARISAKTALKECRPEETIDSIHIGDTYRYEKSMFNHGKNQCLSDYDERVKKFLQ